MPFQDIEETAATETPRSPTVVELWLRKIFVEDWRLKLLALTIALIAWIAVTSQNKPVTIRTSVQLNLIRPDNLEISNDPPKTVDVLLSGSRHDLEWISTPNLVATVDISDQKPGERVVRLSPERVDMDLPQGVKIESFQPSTIPIRLEPLVVQPREVEVRIEGAPADGYEIYGVNPVQNTVRVRGPVSRIDALKKATTETISVDGKTESFTARQVAIDIPDHKVDVLDSVIDVTVEIGEKRAEKSFIAVPAHSASGSEVQPSTASVTLSGPASTIAKLRPEDVKIVVEVATNGASVARLDLPAPVKDQIKLLSIKPSQFSIVR